MRTLLTNLKAGLKLAFLRKTDLFDFQASWHSLLGIIVIILGAHLVIETAIAGYNAQIDSEWWYEYHVAMMASIVVISYLISASTNKADLTLNVIIAFYNAYIFLLLPLMALYSVYPDWLTYDTELYINYAIMAWGFFVTFKILNALGESRAERKVSLGIIIAATLYLLNYEVGMSYFYYAQPEEPRQEAEFPAYERLTSEEIFNMQADAIAEPLAQIKKSEAGETDLFAITFSSYSAQDVFMREGKFVKEQIETKFGATDRTLSLNNNEETIFDIPLANMTNLKAAMDHYKTVMQTEEDILLLYLTSHGYNQGMSVYLDHRHTMQNLSAKGLSDLLDESGIKNRIIIISACHSGSFIPHLENENTLIMTSAATNRQSYGCSDEADLTYFTDALFNHGLKDTTNLQHAFRLAKIRVEQRERDESLPTTSNPQIFIGEDIKNTLKNYRKVDLMQKIKPGAATETEENKVMQNDED